MQPIRRTQRTIHTLYSLDNFWLISQKLKIEWSRLVAANPNVDAANMYVGLKINIPGAGTANNSSSTSSTNNIYTIQPGDNFC